MMKLTGDGEGIAGRGITLEQLRAFVFIAEHRSFSAAGEALGRTQSTLSAGLRRLEEDVGCRLIERKQGHILGLTPEGRQLLPAAHDVLARTSRAVSALSKRGLAGQIALGVPDDFEIANLNRMVALCRAENPELRVTITAAASPVLAELAARHEVDVTITKAVAGQPLSSEHDRLLRVETLHWVSAAPLSFNSLDEIPLVTFPAGCVIRHCAIAALEHASRRHYFSYVSGSFHNICSAVSSGLGIGLLPQSALSDGLHRLTPQDGAPSVPAIQLVLSQVRPGKRNQQFANFMARGLSE